MIKLIDHFNVFDDVQFQANVPELNIHWCTFTRTFSLHNAKQQLTSKICTCNVWVHVLIISCEFTVQYSTVIVHLFEINTGKAIWLIISQET